MKTKTYLLLVMLLTAACEETPEIQAHRDTIARFSMPVVVEDPEGNKFVVQHHVGGTYTVQPIKTK